LTDALRWHYKTSIAISPMNLYAYPAKRLNYKLGQTFIKIVCITLKINNLR